MNTSDSDCCPMIVVFDFQLILAMYFLCIMVMTTHWKAHSPKMDPIVYKIFKQIYTENLGLKSVLPKTYKERNELNLFHSTTSGSVWPFLSCLDISFCFLKTKTNKMYSFSVTGFCQHIKKISPVLITEIICLYS